MKKNKMTAKIFIDIELDFDIATIPGFRELTKEEEMNEFVPEDITKTENEFFKNFLLSDEAKKLLKDNKLTLRIDGVDYK